ncbi:hypothetical protein Tco_1184867 [Tanacetum coccineum]
MKPSLCARDSRSPETLEKRKSLQLFHSGFRYGGIKELGILFLFKMIRDGNEKNGGVARAYKRANAAAAAAATNALITMLKHIREQVTSGVEELSALMTMRRSNSAIVSSCLKSRLLIESQSWGFVPQGMSKQKVLRRVGKGVLAFWKWKSLRLYQLTDFNAGVVATNM